MKERTSNIVIGVVIALFVIFGGFAIYMVNQSENKLEQIKDICSDNNMTSIIPYRTIFCIDDEGRMFYLR